MAGEASAAWSLPAEWEEAAAAVVVEEEEVVVVVVAKPPAIRTEG
jgi:hypothetical protein